MFCHGVNSSDVLKHPASSTPVLQETTSLQHITRIYKTRIGKFQETPWQA
jgi:hypothetical protein